VEVAVDSGRIRSAPNVDAPVQLGVARGEKAVVLESEGAWRRIRLADGRTGWGHRMLFAQIDAEADPPTAGGESEATGPDETAAEPEPPFETSADEKILRTISAIVEETGAETVTFQLGGFHPPETFVIEEGEPKVVCDFMGVKAGETLQRRIAVNGDMVQGIRVGVHESPDPKVRAVVDLARDKTYSVEQVFIKGKGRYILTFKTTGPAD
jgi:hypothetical protein